MGSFRGGRACCRRHQDGLGKVGGKKVGTERKEKKRNIRLHPGINCLRSSSRTFLKAPVQPFLPLNMKPLIELLVFI